MKHLLNRYYLDRTSVQQVGFNPYYHMVDSRLSGTIQIEGKSYLNLASNNYLGLAGDQRIIHAAEKGLLKYGTSLCGTPAATGYHEEMRELEDRLCRLTHTKDCILFPSCYQANQGLFSTFMTSEDIALIDRYAHASLIEGIKGSGCKIRPFLHNQINHLEKILARTEGYRQIFIITESVFSTDGSICPLPELQRIARKYDAVIVIDDSHGIGVLGKHGGGILEHFHIDDFQGLYTASLGKALAGAGGMLAGPAQLIDYLRYYCGAYVYSTALPPSIIFGLRETLNIMDSEFSMRSAKLWSHTQSIHQACFGSSPVQHIAPIQSVICGSTEETFKKSKKLFELGIFATTFVAPSVPAKAGCIRLIAPADATETELLQACRTLEKWQS